MSWSFYRLDWRRWAAPRRRVRHQRARPPGWHCCPSGVAIPPTAEAPLSGAPRHASPPPFWPVTTDMHWNQRTRATAKESDWEGRGEAAAYRRLSLRTKSLTSGCTSGMAARAKGNPRRWGGVRIWVGDRRRGASWAGLGFSAEEGEGN